MCQTYCVEKVGVSQKTHLVVSFFCCVLYRLVFYIMSVIKFHFATEGTQIYKDLQKILENLKKTLKKKKAKRKSCFELK